MAGWSKAFMPDRFHADALRPSSGPGSPSSRPSGRASSILNALGVLIGADLTRRLGEIGCPTLLLHPDGSPFIPVPVMAELHRLLPNAELNVIGHARHGLPFSHATRVRVAAADFSRLPRDGLITFASCQDNIMGKR